ncbi:hypothetical protein [Deinococcus fonticola]|uniref:hypothetical protein n=1 Tax=Deinococcus fonticola TaxID=2528713 RepID=UPI0010756D61|nr:hypothetical protein [Deinococcus fonticola]
MNRGTALNPPGFLATQDLKDRGWTPALIRRFLGEHDSTRPNGLKMGRRRLPPVKLYREERVHEAESDDTFLAAQAKAADARERAEQTRAARLARRQAQLQDAVDSFTPIIDPVPLRKGATRKAREPYLRLLEQVQERLERELENVTEKESEQLREGLLERLDAALSQVYAWFPAPGRHDREKGSGKS